MYIYFLTIDKVLLDRAPTKDEIFAVRDKLMLDTGLIELRPYKCECFEIKYKGRKHGMYLHYHALLASYNSYIPYTSLRALGWSIKLIKLKTNMDVANTAAYINKLKISYCLI